MRGKRLIFIAALLLMAFLVAGLGWLSYTPIHQNHLNSALIDAINLNDTQKALALLSAGADPNARDEPPQHLSLWRVMLDKLRGKRPATSTAPTALVVAVDRNPGLPISIVIIKALLDRGAVVNIKGPDGFSPLQDAVRNPLASDEVIEALLNKGADVNCDYNEMPPLMIAAFMPRTRVLRLLLKHHADPNLRVDGKNILAFAREFSWHASKTMPTVIKILKQAGAKD